MLGAGSIEVAIQCSDRVSSPVEYERRLNSWYGEGQHKSIDTIERGPAIMDDSKWRKEVWKAISHQGRSANRTLGTVYKLTR